MPELGPCASSGRAWRLRAARRSLGRTWPTERPKWASVAQASHPQSHPLVTQACEDGDGSLRKALWAQSEKLVAEAGLALPETRLLGRREAAPVA